MRQHQWLTLRVQRWCHRYIYTDINSKGSPDIGRYVHPYNIRFGQTEIDWCFEKSGTTPNTKRYFINKLDKGRTVLYHRMWHGINSCYFVRGGAICCTKVGLSTATLFPIHQQLLVRWIHESEEIRCHAEESQPWLRYTLHSNTVYTNHIIVLYTTACISL